MSAALGHRLAQIRRSAALTPERMAAELGVTQEDLLAVEAGTRTFALPKFVSDWASVAGADDQEQSLLSLWRESAP